MQKEYEVAKTTKKALLRVANYESKKHQLNLEGLRNILLILYSTNSVN